VTIARAVELRLIQLPLVQPFRTSFGTETEKICVIVRVETDEADGWGECVAGPDPGFSDEFNEGAWLVLRDFLVPALFEAGDVETAGLEAALQGFRGNRMAKAALIAAFLDAELRAEGRSMAGYLGGTRERVECGISVGIASSTGELMERVDAYLAQGFRRVKLKIEPGADVERVSAVRAAHPDIALSVDANAAYSLEDVDVFHAMDPFGLLMIEQPLMHEDLVQHARLQEMIATDICLDESIRSSQDASAAIELGACRIINIKQGRVGGVLEAHRVHDVARAAGTPVWCGGMLETGIGRALNLALASLPGFTLPGDTSPSSRYFAEDLTEPFEMAPDGTMAVPTGPGIGVAPRPDRLEACSRRVERISRAV
jgi:o-succinylbenzoate synthase